MKPITLSINPTYLCNFRCPSCYLTPSQLADTTTTPIDTLDRLMGEVSAAYEITHIDLYGGEIGTLPWEYQRDLYCTIRKYYGGTINVVTNLLKSFYLMDQPGVDLSVSYDFEHRERYTVVYRNMKQLTRNAHILVLATPEVMAGDVDNMITMLNAVPRAVSVEIKPYSTNQANQHHATHAQFEEFVKRWLTSPIPKQFEFTNETELRNVLTGSRNSFSDDHLYITPSGRYAVLEFDLNDNEFFHQLDTIDQYIQWTEREKQRSFANSYCMQCEYLGRCLTEHIRDVKSVDNSCNGYYKLIKWYKHENMETQPRSLSPNSTTG